MTDENNTSPPDETAPMTLEGINQEIEVFFNFLLNAESIENADKQKWINGVMFLNSVIQNLLEFTEDSKKIKARAYFVFGLSNYKMKNWDEVIKACNQAIDLNPNDVESYSLRAQVCLIGKGEFDKAIHDQTEIISKIEGGQVKKEPSVDKGRLQNAYFMRALAYRKKKAWSEAARDFKKVIDSGFTDPLIYTDLGNAHAQLENMDEAHRSYRTAIDGYNRMLGQASTKQDKKQIRRDLARLYSNVASAHKRERKYNEAINSYSEAISHDGELLTNYLNRFSSRIQNGEMEEAINGIDSTGIGPINESYDGIVSWLKRKPEQSWSNLFNSDPYIFLLWITHDLGENDFSKEIFTACAKMMNTIGYILDMLFIRAEENNKFIFAQYTSVETLQSLSKSGGMHFRFYDASSMNDPKEGKYLFRTISRFLCKNKQESDSMKEEVQAIEEWLNIEETENMDKESLTTTYIGSFVMGQEGESPLKVSDKLEFWRSYGRDAEGCSLVFKRGSFAKMRGDLIGEKSHILQSPPSPEEPISLPYKGSHLVQSLLPDYKIINSKNSKSSLAQPVLPIYRIIYESYLEGTDSSLNSEESKRHKSLKQKLKNLWKYINEVKEKIDKIGSDEKKETMRRFVCACVDEIRFLFKSDYYKFENEARVVIPRARRQAQNDPIVHDDEQRTPPRPYLEASDNFRFDEVILGPRVPDKKVEQWKFWLHQRKRVKGSDDKAIKVEKSKAFYVKN